MATILIFIGAAAAANPGRNPPQNVWEFAVTILVVAPFVTAYVILVGLPAYCLMDRFARVDRFGRRSWRAYCLTALAAGIPYFGISVAFHPFWNVPLLIAPLVASLAYGTIGYWLVERGWPWHWRRRDEIEDGWRRRDKAGATDDMERLDA